MGTDIKHGDFLVLFTASISLLLLLKEKKKESIPFFFHFSSTEPTYIVQGITMLDLNTSYLGCSVSMVPRLLC